MKTWKVVKTNGNECWVTYPDDCIVEVDSGMLRFSTNSIPSNEWKVFTSWIECYDVTLSNKIENKTTEQKITEVISRLDHMQVELDALGL